MKKIYLLTLSLFLASATMAFAQQESKLVDINAPMNITNIQKLEYDGPIVEGESLNKTSGAIRDTLDSHMTECMKISGYSFGFLQTDLLGFITGTTRASGGEIAPGVPAMPFTVAEIIVRYSFKPSPLVDSTVVTGVMLPHDYANKANRHYELQVVGSPDTFAFKIYGDYFDAGKSLHRPDVEGPVYGQQDFIIVPETLVVFEHLITFDNPMKVPGDTFYVSVRVNQKGNDDTLRLKINDSSNNCGFGQKNTFIYTRDTATWTTQESIAELNGFGGLSIDADVLLLPIIEMRGASVNRDAYIESNNLKVFPVYPNPANEVANIKYELNENSPVQFMLMDSKGLILKKTDFKMVQAGVQTISVDVSDVAPGAYFYNLRTTSGNITTKFVVTK